MVGIRHGTDYRVGGRGTVGLSHVVLGDSIIHMFNDEMHMGRCSVPSTTIPILSGW